MTQFQYSELYLNLIGVPEDVAAYCRHAWKKSSSVAHSRWKERNPEIVQAPKLADDPGRPFRIADWAMRRVAIVFSAPPIVDIQSAWAAIEEARYRGSFGLSARGEAVHRAACSAAAHAADTFATPPAAAADMYAASVAAYKAASCAAQAVRSGPKRDALLLDGLNVLLNSRHA